MSNVENPYVGTRTFSEEEAHLFFGREREARDLLALVLTEQVVLFYAQSGTGKSSLLNTRIIPNLEKGKGFEALLTGRVTGELPSNVAIDNVYIYSLMRNLVTQEVEPEKLANLQLKDFLRHLVRDQNSPKKSYAYQETASTEVEPRKRKRRLLIIDQFEELFSTHPEEWQCRSNFFEQLAQAMEDDPYLWLLLVMREDYIAYLDPYAHLMSGGLRVRYYMQRMEYDAALKAVSLPVKNLRPYADGVAEELVEDLCGKQTRERGENLEIVRGQYVEPIVLQAVCSTLWENLPPEGSQITFENKKVVGDVNQALGKYYEKRVRTVAELPEVKAKGVKEAEIRKWFGTRLITKDGKRTIVVRERGGKSGGLDDDVIQIFKRLNDLVREEEHSGSSIYELTHDRLADPIRENNIIWEKQYGFPFRQQAELWKESMGKEIHLLNSEALEEAEKWEKENPNKLTDNEKEFLEACRIKQQEIARELEHQRQAEERQREREKEEQEQKLRQQQLEAAEKLAAASQQLAQEQSRSARRARRGLIAAVVFAIAALIASIFAVRGTQKANEQTRLAKISIAKGIADQATIQRNLENSRAYELASSALDRSKSFEQSILLGVAAYQKSQTNPQAQTALSYISQGVDRLDRIFSRYLDPIEAFEVSPDGQTLALRGENDITIWDLKNGPLVSIPENDASVAMYFSQDSKTLAIVDKAGIHLRDVSSTDPSLGRGVNYHPGEIAEMSISRDGKTLVALGEDKTIFRANLANNQNTKITIPLQGDFVVSPTSETVAIVEPDETITVWSLIDDEQIGDSIPGTLAAFSQDGKMLAASGNGSSITLMDLETREEKSIVTDLDNVQTMIFDPTDSRYLALSSSDTTIIWDLENEQRVGAVLPGIPQMFSPNGDSLIFFNTYDGTRNIFCRSENFVSEVPLPGSIQGMSPDGTVFAIRDFDGFTTLWKLAEDCELTQIENSAFSAQELQFNPAGSVLASLDTEGIISIRDIQNGALVSDPLYEPQDSEIDSEGTLTFSPDGTWLAFHQGTLLLLWNMAERAKVTLPESLASESIDEIQFATNDRLVIRHPHGKIEVLNIPAGTINPLTVDAKGKIDNVVFDEEQNRMLSIARNTLFLVDTRNGDPLSKQMDGTMLAVDWKKGHLATLLDGNVLLWDIQTGTQFGDSIPGDLATFSADGGMIAIGDGKLLSIYRLDGNKIDMIGKPVDYPVQTEEVVSGPYELQFSPNGKAFAIAANSSYVYIYKIDPNAIEPFRDHSGYPYGGLMVFASDTTLYFKEGSYPYVDVLDWTSGTVKTYYQSVTGSIPIAWDTKTLFMGESNSDTTQPSPPLTSVTLWDTEDFDASHKIKMAGTIHIYSNDAIRMTDYKIPQNHKELFALGEDGNIYQWNADNEYVSDITDSIGDVDNPVMAAAISPNGQKQAWFTKNGIVLANTTADLVSSNPFNAHTLRIDSGVFNSDGNMLAVTGENGTNIFYQVQGAKRIGEPIEGSILYYPYVDPQIWITSNDDSKILWNARTGAKITELSPKETFQDFSAKGNFATISDAEGNIVLWDIVKGTRIGDPIPGTFKAVSPDGRLVAVEDANQKSTTLLEVDSQEQVNVPARFVAFSPDSHYVALQGSEDSFTLLESETLQKTGEPIEGVFLSFSPKSNFMAYRVEDQIFLWEFMTNKPLGQPMKGDSAVFSPDDRVMVVTDSVSGTGSIVNTKTGRQVGELIDSSIQSYGTETLPLIYLNSSKGELVLLDLDKGQINKEPIPGSSVIESQDGKTIAVTYSDPQSVQKTRLWNRVNGEPLTEELDLPRLEGFSPNGKILIQRNSDGSASLLDVFSPNAPETLIDGELVIFSPHYDYAVAQNRKNNTIKLWDINNHVVKDDLSKIYPGVITTVVFSSDTKTLALLGNAGVVLWDVRKASQIGESPLQESSGVVNRLAFSADNKFLASVGTDGIVIWKLDPSPSVKNKIPSNKQILSLNFNTADTVIYLEDDYSLLEGNINSGSIALLGKVIDTPTAVCSMAMNYDGSQIAYQIGKRISLWDKNTANATKLEVRPDQGCSALAFSPDGSKLLIGDGSRIHIWDLGNNSEESPLLDGKGTFSTVSNIAFFDYRKLAVQGDAGNKTTISLWYLDSRSNIGFPFQGSLYGFTSAASHLFYRDDKGRVILEDSSSESAILARYNKIRDNLCRIIGRNFFYAEWIKYFPQDRYPTNQADATCPQWPLDPEAKGSIP